MSKETVKLVYNPSLKGFARLIYHNIDDDRVAPEDPVEAIAEQLKFVVMPSNGWPKDWTEAQKLRRIEAMSDEEMAEGIDAFLSSHLTQRLPAFLDKLVGLVTVIKSLQDRLKDMGFMEDEEGEETPKTPET